MEWKLEGGVNLKAKIFILWIWVLLRENSRLSLDVPLIDGESAFIFVQAQDTASIYTQVVVEHEHLNPDLKD